MFGRLVRRLGFEQTVPVSLVDDWHVPAVERTPIEIAPRGGAASCRVDQFGRIQPEAEPWAVELSFAAGARWVAASQTERIRQQVLVPGVVATTFETPSGPVVQRVAAGVVDGQPAAIVEVENTGGVAIAVGVVIRPIGLDGRGYIGEAAATERMISIDGRPAVGFVSKPASVAAIAGAQGDLLGLMPDPAAGEMSADAVCRSGGAQAVAVWPVPHTATLRFVVPLDAAPRSDAAVPATEDVQRGWQAHLKHGLRVEVDELPVQEHLTSAIRSTLTLWPDVDETPSAIVALAEAGFGRDSGRLFDGLERYEEDDRVLRALARWAQLGEQAHQLEDLDRVLGRLARAAHIVANSGGRIAGEPWLPAALIALGGRLHQIGQPDVADRIQSFDVHEQSLADRADALGAVTKRIDKRGVWPESQMAEASRYVRALRSVIIEDAGDEVRVLPEVPTLWRGRAIDVLGLPLADGSLSFGLRWHGPRPALLWEASLTPEAPFRLRAPGIDSDFESDDRQGEVLLADPGWGAQ